MLLRQHNDFDKTFFIFSSPIFIISNHLHIAVFAPFLTTHFPNQAAANDSWSPHARKICHFHKFSQFLSFPEATKSAVYNAMLDHLNQILLNDLDLELDLEQEENEVKFFPHCLKITPKCLIWILAFYNNFCLVTLFDL